MHPPAAATVGNLGGSLDDSPDQPLHGALDVFALQMKLPYHVRQVVCQGSHFHSRAWLVSNRWQLVLSQRRVFLASLIRFSTLARPL